MNSASCDMARTTLFDSEVDAEQRKRLTEALAHLDGCEACQAAVRDYDRIRDTLASFRSDAEPEGGWSAFENRLLQVRLQPKPWRAQNWYALAASVLIGALGFDVGRLWTRAPGPRAQMGQAVATGDFSAPLAAFKTVSKVLDGRANWVMLTNGGSGVDVSPEPVDPPGKVLCLRLSMSRQGIDVSDTDLMILPGRHADLTVPIAQEQSLHYAVETSKEEPTRLRLRLEIRTPRGNEVLAALATNVQMKPGDRLSAGQLATTAGEYELKISFAEARLGAERP